MANKNKDQRTLKPIILFSDLLEKWRDGDRYEVASHVRNFRHHKLLEFTIYGMKYEGITFITDLKQLLPD